MTDPLREWVPVPPSRRSPWRTAGMVLAVVVAIGGLAMVAFTIWFVVALGSWGSNK